MLRPWEEESGLLQNGYDACIGFMAKIACSRCRLSIGRCLKGIKAVTGVQAKWAFAYTALVSAADTPGFPMGTTRR
jgi:hypothetical protein